MGSSTAGGSTEAMRASNRSPPAAPVEMPRNEVTSEAAVRPRNTCGETSGIPESPFHLPDVASDDQRQADTPSDGPDDGACQSWGREGLLIRPFGEPKIHF